MRGVSNKHCLLTFFIVLVLAVQSVESLIADIGVVTSILTWPHAFVDFFLRSFSLYGFKRAAVSYKLKMFTVLVNHFILAYSGKMLTGTLNHKPNIVLVGYSHRQDEATVLT